MKVGQFWKYKDGYEGSYVVILKVEERRGQEIVHISVNGLPFEDVKDIGHMPFAKSTVEENLTDLISENNELPDFEEGYQMWNDAWENGQGGIYTISVKKAVEFVIDTLNSAD